MPLVAYKASYVLKHEDLPGIRKFAPYFQVFTYGVMPIDRTFTLKFPIRTKSLFPIPQLRSITETYEEICDQSAVNLLRLNVPMYVFWSGGVDSTCALVSLLKNANSAQRSNITVLLSNNSINEYPAFYRDHIRGKLTCDSSVLFPYLLGTKNLIVNGEGNDQLFGSDIIADFVNAYGFDTALKQYSPDTFRTFFSHKMQDNTEAGDFFVSLFEQLKEAAPVSITSNYDLFWWVNFALKWQTVYMRTLSFAAKRNRDQVTVNNVRTYYQPFFNTEKFQLWSLNNLDKRVKDSWRSYKWPAKDVIYNYTKDADYRDNKIKRGSLQFLFRQQGQATFIDDKFNFHDRLPSEAWYQGQNDFV